MISRAIVFEGAGRPLTLRDVPVPEVRGSEILVEVTACTLCGSDLHTIEGRRATPVPTILGHEILGRIVAFGPSVARTDAAGQILHEGDRVTWSVVASCGGCFFCLRDLPQKCERQTKYGHEVMSAGRELTGGLAAHCVLMAGTAVFRVPESLSDAVACPSSCATATVAAAIEASGDLRDRVVVVMGAGMLGVTACAWASRWGATVIACDRVPERLSVALEFGASRVVVPDDLETVVREITSGRGVDVAIEMTGAAEAVESLVPALRIGGRLILVGSVFPSRSVAVFPEQVVRRCLTIQGVHNYAPRHLGHALTFLSDSESLPFANLVGEWRALDDLAGMITIPHPARGLRIGVRP